MFDKIKENIRQKAEEREQRIREEKEKEEQRIREEKEKLMELSEKELLVEILMKLRGINSRIDDVESRVNDVELKLYDIDNSIRFN